MKTLAFCAVTVLGLAPAVDDETPMESPAVEAPAGSPAEATVDEATTAEPVESEPIAAELEPVEPIAAESEPVVLKESPFGDTDKVKVAVMDLRGSAAVDSEFMAMLTDLVPQTLEDLGPFAAISGHEIDQLLELQQLRDQLGCDDVESCLAEIGGALGADYLVSSRLTLVDDTYLMQMQLLKIATARVFARIEREYQGGPKGLLDEVRTATKLLVRDVLAQKSGILELTVSEEAATVKVDGSIVGVSPLPPLSLSGGMHTVSVDKQGFVMFVRDVAIVSQQTTKEHAALAPSQEFLRDYRAQAEKQRGAAWISMGAGGAGVVTSVALYIAAEAEARDLRKEIKAFKAAGSNDPVAFEDIQDHEKKIGTMDVWTIITGSIGVVGLGVGSYLYFAGDEPDRYDVTTDLGPAKVTLVPASGGVGLAGQF